MKNGLEIDNIGNKCYYLNDQLHREDGPAIEYSAGDKFWYQNDKLHRINGPAIEFANGKKYWYYQGRHIECQSQQEFEKLLKLKVFW